MARMFRVRVRKKIIIGGGRKVGKWKGSAYSRYKKPRSPGSGVEFHDRKLNPVYMHFYGTDARERKKIPIRGAR